MLPWLKTNKNNPASGEDDGTKSQRPVAVDEDLSSPHFYSRFLEEVYDVEAVPHAGRSAFDEGRCRLRTSPGQHPSDDRELSADRKTSLSPDGGRQYCSVTNHPLHLPQK